MKKVIALLLAAVMVFALCACGQQGAEGKDPAAKLPEFKLGIPMENTANPAQYSYLENMVYLCGNFPNGGTAVAEADDLTDPDHTADIVADEAVDKRQRVAGDDDARAGKCGQIDRPVFIAEIDNDQKTKDTADDAQC